MRYYKLLRPRKKKKKKERERRVGKRENIDTKDEIKKENQKSGKKGGYTKHQMQTEKIYIYML